MVDLENHRLSTSNEEVISVFSLLQCGSRNHLRSFVSLLKSVESDYAPQFLEIEAYEAIANGINEQCSSASY
ncbi:MAG: DUF2202 domain-containing protein [Prolixibacteraceae bacterium]